jgi:hypothetical protein
MSQGGASPREGERWLHKGTGAAVIVTACIGERVLWRREDMVIRGKGTLGSFLDRFELPVDLMAELERSLEDC